MDFAVCFSRNHALNHRLLLLTSVVSPYPCAVSQILTLPSSPANKALHHLKLNHPPRTSSEGIPHELAEDSKFVPLNADDPEYGLPALLFLGFQVEEVLKIKQLLKELDGEFLEVIFCTEDMIDRSLWEAMNTKQPNLEAVKIAKSLPRICFFSGLSGEEMMMFIDAFPETANRHILSMSVRMNPESGCFRVFLWPN
ncbi:uncharacterized protein LOC107413208 isoform X1 [Ziziphus jujuba]|uniref:Uncharacterized protein LOC107413208 isoform X1 n=1 Tax=Ziziphus jujuba TaxID=326968 RepID=A0ABM4AH31_ZIZJJ|nr:uncharacterized protein LOC107413208 isoform X1 [Ziziphus jujuba]